MNRRSFLRGLGLLPFAAPLVREVLTVGETCELPRRAVFGGVESPHLWLFQGVDLLYEKGMEAWNSGETPPTSAFFSVQNDLWGYGWHNEEFILCSEDDPGWPPPEPQ